MQTEVVKTKRRIRWPIVILVIAAVILIVWVGLLARDTLALRTDLQALQDDAASLPNPIKPEAVDLARVQQHVTSFYDNLSALRNHASPLLAIAPAFGWLPKIGGDIKSAPAMLDLGLELTSAASRGLIILSPVWPALKDSGLSLEALARILQVLQPAMSSFRANVNRAGEIRQQIDKAALSPQFQSALDRFDKAYPSMQTGLDLLEAASPLLGVDRPRTYLLLLQNEDELRATGGFISAVGRVTLDSGKIITLTVEDSYQIDDFTKPYPDPPAPLLDYMGLQLWVFRDSNWSPDFPTAAREAVELYTQTRGGAIDGVIALNQKVVEALVSGLGPLTLDELSTAGAQDVRTYMRNAWSYSGQGSAAEWVQQRKAFIGRLMQVILNRAIHGNGQMQWQALALAIDGMLRSRDLLIAFTDPTLNQTLQDARLDGALRPNDGDYMMVVDSNLGYNKANAAIQEAMQYTLTLSTDQEPHADLTIVYTHTGQSDAGCVHAPPDYRVAKTYAQLINQCYWNYRRVLVPAGAQLIDASRHPTGPGELLTGIESDGTTHMSMEDGKTFFSTLLIVPPGQRVESRLSYTLPSSAVQVKDNQQLYHLVWQKQPGAGSWPVTVTVTWPADRRLIVAQPQPIDTTDRSATFRFTLNADREISVTIGR